MSIKISFKKSILGKISSNLVLFVDEKFNIKLIIDFQEEMGSPTVVSAVSLHKEKLKSDFLLIIDGPRHPSNKPTLTFGARGISLSLIHI